MASRAAVASVVLAGVLFGTAGTAQALGPIGTTPLGVGAARLLIGGAVLLVIVAPRGDFPHAVLRLWKSKAGVIAGVCSAAYQVCFFGSVELTGVALGTLVTVASAPVLAGLLAWAAFRDRPTRPWAVATCLCIAGLILLSYESLGVAQPLGLLLALAAGLASATWNVAAKKLLDAGAATLDVLTGTFLLGGMLLLPLLMMQPKAWMFTVEGAILAVYLGFATMAAANWLMASGLKRLAPGPVTTLTLTDPVTATFLSVMVLGETLSLPAEAGFLLVLLGLLAQSLASTMQRTRRDSNVVPLI